MTMSDSYTVLNKCFVLLKNIWSRIDKKDVKNSIRIDRIPIEDLPFIIDWAY